LVRFSLGFSLIWLGCATTQTGATADDLARARTQAAQGATIFTNECAKCHGDRGEGLAGAPAILGPGALPEYPRSTGSGSDPMVLDPQLIQVQAQTRPAGAASRDRFRNVEDLHSFMVRHVPKTRAQELQAGDYWAVVSFILAAQGASLPPQGIGPANAASMPIPKR
jgi:mono/diheme cytochrome c family protein